MLSIFDGSESNPPVTILSLKDLNEQQFAKLTELQQYFEDAQPEELLGYLKIRGFNIAEAKAQFESTLNWRKQNPDPKIHEIQAFLRTPDGCDGPDGCVFLLEKEDMVDSDGNRDCARDI